MPKKQPTFQPMLSASFDHRTKLRYPLLVSPKYDGFRCLIVDGVPMTRSLKQAIPNKIVREALSGLPWLDGELIVGSPNAPGVLRRTSSGITAAEGEPDWTYFVFDVCDPMHSLKPFKDRLEMTEELAKKARERLANPGRLVVVPHVAINDQDTLFATRDSYIALGYEGMMARDPFGKYKWGRSTGTEGWLVKFKTWEDAEAVVLEAIEEEENRNEAFTNALGKTERSTHKANKVGKGTLGGYRCKTYWAAPGPESGRFDLRNNSDEALAVEFWCGASANSTAEERKVLWDERHTLPNRVMTFQYQFRLGVDRPQHPTFKAWEVAGER